jgi:flagellin-like hook-associated protein FlgL
MASNVALGAGMRANLLSLSRTNESMDKTAFILSTGRKVNSALDNPQSFFAAQSLTNRAGDLSRLLDSMGQSISTIKAADNAVTSMTKLVEQADAIASQARDTLASAETEATTITGNVDLSDVDDLDVDLTNVVDGAKLKLTVVDADGTDVTSSLTNGGSVTLADGDGINQLLDKIRGLNTATSGDVIDAKLDDKGQLQISALNGASYSLSFAGDANGFGGDNTANLALAAALGFEDSAESLGSGSETGQLFLSGANTASATYTAANVASGENLTVTAVNRNTGELKTYTVASGDNNRTIDEFISDFNTAVSGGEVVAGKDTAGTSLTLTGASGWNFSVANGTIDVGADLGFQTYETARDAAGASDVRITSTSAASLTSVSLFSAADTLASEDDALTSLFVDSNASSSLIKAYGTGAEITATDNLVVGVNSGTAKEYSLSGLTVRGLTDRINRDFEGKIEATFNATSGKINIRSVDSSVTSVEFGIENNDGDNDAVSARFGFGIKKALTAFDTAGTRAVESIRLGQGAGEVAQLEKDFNKVRTQIDQLVADSHYRGVNLLDGDNLTTAFNEDRSTSLVTEGAILSSSGLQLNAANFSSVGIAETTMTTVREALVTVREFSASLATDLAIIQTRQDFTKETINTLEEGADKLTLADPNEEGAKMLALQTRLQLGVTSLSLASQSQQSVLSLFG